MVEEVALNGLELHLKRVVVEVDKAPVQAFCQFQFLILRCQMNKEIPIALFFQFIHQSGGGIPGSWVFLQATYGVPGYIHNTATPLLKGRAMGQDH